MRIIKLSIDKFETFEEVETFFNELPFRSPVGKFRVTKGRIARNSLEIGEKIIFSYRTRVCYIAETASKLLKNVDQYSDEFPFFFQIDVNTLRPASLSLHELEKILHQNGIQTKAIVKTMGWPKIHDSSMTERLWRSLKK